MPTVAASGRGLRRMMYHLITRKYHLQCGKNRMIPYRYHMILYKYHMIPASSPVHGPHRSSSPATASSAGTSSPAATSIVHASAGGCVLHAGARHRCRRHHYAGSSAVHAPRRSSSPAPSLSPHAGSSTVHATMPHAGTRRQPRPPCRSSATAAAASAADVSLICAAPMVAFILASEEGGQGAIPLEQYLNGIPVYSSSPIESIDSGEDG
uniref:Uncharacterized protein n=1 Tax=Oryza rufipogon TaxID=4529 RepID=A0A0E0PA72_ORYRU